MRDADIGDHADGGPGNFGKPRDLARTPHCHLDHRGFMRGFQLEDRLRHADLIIEVARARQHAESPTQRTGDHLLGGSLADAARDAYDSYVLLFPHPRSEITESDK